MRQTLEANPEGLASQNTCPSALELAESGGGNGEVVPVGQPERLELPSLASTGLLSDHLAIAAEAPGELAYLNPWLLQWPVPEGEGPAAKHTPLPSSPDSGRVTLKRGDLPLCPPTPALPPAASIDTLWSDYAALEDEQAYSACLQAAVFDGTDCKDLTGKVVSGKPATRIKIVGKWANHAFMEEYFRFPSPSDDAKPILGVDNRSAEKQSSDVDTPELSSDDSDLSSLLFVERDICPHPSTAIAATSRSPGTDESYQGDRDCAADAYCGRASIQDP
ncbi:hypothetical protein VTK26DRAFT_3119 [Humicola hyalothermophila]